LDVRHPWQKLRLKQCYLRCQWEKSRFPVVEVSRRFIDEGHIVLTVEVAEALGDPVLGGYLIPEDAHVPCSLVGASGKY
jgi:hypothetical protein